MPMGAMSMIEDGSTESYTRKSASSNNIRGAMGTIEDASSKNTDGRYGYERGWFDAPVPALGRLTTRLGRFHKAGSTAKIPFQSRVV